MNKFLMTLLAALTCICTACDQNNTNKDVTTMHAKAETADFSYDVIESANRVTFRFQSKVGSGWVDVHYKKNYGTLYNHRMTATGSSFEQESVEFTVETGDIITFFFTYDKGGLAYDSPEFTYTCGDGTGSVVISKAAPVTIEAEDYSDMFGIQTENCSEGTLNVGWIDTGDWLDYEVMVQDAGQYTIEYRVASLYDTGEITCMLDGSSLARIAVPDQDGWQNWTTVSSDVYLPAGQHTIRLYASGQLWNLNWFSITAKNSGEWQIVWQDTFDGSGSLDPNNWNYHIGNGYNNDLAAFQGWGNGEWEWYRKENAYRENGNLVIKAEYYDSPLIIENREWYQTSARVTTQGLRSFKYGRIEARISLPNNIGTWPAFWMMGDVCDATVNAPNGIYDIMATNWSSCGEIDIMEHRNLETVVTHNYFWDSRIGVFPWGDGQNNYNATENAPVGDVTQFHLYTIEWDEQQIKWYIDRETNPVPTKVADITAGNQEEFHKKFFIILNLALCGQFTGYAEPDKAEFPLYMYVDYVRVWQK